MINLGVGLHWDSSFSSDNLISLIKDIELLGYDQIWVSNEKFFHDMYITASVVAQNTKNIKIGTFIVDPYTIHPALSTVAIATLDEISHGRALLGIGAGGTGFPEMGISRHKPVQAIRETIVLVRELLSGKKVSFNGKIINLSNCQINFKTRSNIPIVLASRGDQILQLGGEIADKVMIATYAEPNGINHAVNQVRKGTSRSNRQFTYSNIISRVDACISDDHNDAINAVKPMVGVILWNSYPNFEFVNHVGLTVPPDIEKLIAKRDYSLIIENSQKIPDEFVDKYCWAGTASEVAHKVAKVINLGIQDIIFLPMPSKKSPIRNTITKFIQEVIPLALDISKFS